MTVTPLGRPVGVGMVKVNGVSTEDEALICMLTMMMSPARPLGMPPVCDSVKVSVGAGTDVAAAGEVTVRLTLTSALPFARMGKLYEPVAVPCAMLTATLMLCAWLLLSVTGSGAKVTVTPVGGALLKSKV